MMRREIRFVLLIAAVAVSCQGQIKDFNERLRKTLNHVDDTDVVRIEKDIERARLYLDKTWKSLMSSKGLAYKPPFVIDGARTAFSSIPSKCSGTVSEFDNASYCPADNTISYDGFFLAGISNTIGARNHSRGDFAAIVTLAHENGHALQHQLGITSTFDFQNEQNADCFAGATAYQMQIDGVLQSTDIPEARAAFTLLADLKRAGPFENDAHGDKLQRVAAFDSGYKLGPVGCASMLKELRGLPAPWRPGVVKK